MKLCLCEITFQAMILNLSYSSDEISAIKYINHHSLLRNFNNECVRVYMCVCFDDTERIRAVYVSLRNLIRGFYELMYGFYIDGRIYTYMHVLNVFSVPLTGGH